MAINANSTSIKLFLHEDDEWVKKEFKKLVADSGTSMSKRLLELVKSDISYWKKHGEPMPLEVQDE